MKRRVYRRKKRYTRKRVVSRVARSVNLKKDLHFFKRSYFDGTIVGNVAHAPYLEGKQTTFQQLPGFLEFSSMFDRYKITYLKVFYHLKIDPSAQTSSSASFPKLYIVKDYDDSVIPASINFLREHAKCYYRVMNPNRPVVINIKPSTLALTYRSPIASTYIPQWNKWIDMANVDVPHYGWKIVIDDLTNVNYRVDVEVKVWFQCKDTR